MATQRYVSTSFWDDDWIQTLDPSEKLLFLYYMTCPLTNISGVYKITSRRVSFDTGFTSDTIGHIMQKFEKAKKVYRFGEYIIIPSWPNHQKWESAPRIKDGIMANLRDMDQSTLHFLVAVGYKFDLIPVFDTLGIPYPYPSSYSDSDLDSELDTDTDFEDDNFVLETEPEPKRKPAKPSSPAKAVDPLYHPIQQSFLSQGNFADYAKEGKCIHAIIKKIRSLTPDTAEDTARKILENFRALTQGNERFWKDRPFLPSSLAPCLEQVWTIVQKGSAVPSMEWFDKIVAEFEANK